MLPVATENTVDNEPISGVFQLKMDDIKPAIVVGMSNG